MKRVVTVVAVLGLVLVGSLSWGLAVPAAPSGSPGPTSPGRTAGPSTAGGPGASASPASHVVPQLEAILPDTLAGVTLAKDSATGDVVLGSSPWGQAMRTFLASVGKQPSDLRFAQAHDPTGSLDAVLVAVQVPGLPAARLADAIVAGSRPDYPELEVASLTLGGKPTTRVIYGDGGSDTYLYERDDIVFDVETSTASTAATALAALP